MARVYAVFDMGGNSIFSLGREMPVPISLICGILSCGIFHWRLGIYLRLLIKRYGLGGHHRLGDWKYGG
jgi:hypothetical protein